MHAAKLSQRRICGIVVVAHSYVTAMSLENEHVYLRFFASSLLFGRYDGFQILLSPLLLTTVATIRSAGDALNVCDNLLGLVCDGLFDVRSVCVHHVSNVKRRW